MPTLATSDTKKIYEYDSDQDSKDIDLGKVEREIKDEILSDDELMNIITDFTLNITLKLISTLVGHVESENMKHVQ